MTAIVDASTGASSVERTAERLSRTSARRVIEPEVDLPGVLGEGRLIADELLSVAGIDIDLTSEQRARLSREEVAAIAEEGTRFEAILTAGFALQMSKAPDLTDPRIIYLLHELGEETRHSRLFISVLASIEPAAVNTFERGVLGFVKHRVVRDLILGRPALMYVLVLAGEEIPDLIQKHMAEHPETDPYVREVNRYHRQEEARHLAFARTMLPELWQRAPRRERFLVRHVAPLLIEVMFDSLVHPGVYRTAGLPGWRTWWAVKHSPARLALRHEATTPVLAAACAAGVFCRGRPTRRWKKLVGR
ncbi:MAG: diiron oxygenase [Actinomycetota bacterium]|nr:diiron oxygenase [Actinomycetota bacterium]